MIPSVPTLVRIATALRVAPDTLLGFSPAPSARPHRRPALQRLIGLLERADDDTMRAVLVVARVVLRTREKTARRGSKAR
jgi:hypothetical protein